jgi:NAD(P)-dependent dehydrogenase (short-subunit alcohol dehydrogenase family)
MSKILIVGGSKGIGSAILSIASADHSCINMSRTEPSVVSSNVVHHTIDVLEDELPELEDISSIVYCPGSITLKPISSLKESDFLSDYQINVIGAVRVIKKYASIIKKQENASIVLFSTVAVGQGMPFHSSIAAAKAAVEALSKSLAAELAPTIRVNCIAPSIVDTSLASGILRSDKSRDNLKAKHPLKKILTPEEIAEMAYFLISPKASGITGQVIGVDAGLSSLKI